MGLRDPAAGWLYWAKCATRHPYIRSLKRSKLKQIAAIAELNTLQLCPLHFRHIDISEDISLFLNLEKVRWSRQIETMPSVYKEKNNWSDYREVNIFCTLFMCLCLSFYRKLFRREHYFYSCCFPQGNSSRSV